MSMPRPHRLAMTPALLALALGGCDKGTPPPAPKTDAPPKAEVKAAPPGVEATVKAPSEPAPADTQAEPGTALAWLRTSRIRRHCKRRDGR